MNRARFEALHAGCRDLVLRHMTVVLRNREDAEDVTSAAFAAAWRSFDRFRGESSFSTWVSAIAMNEAMNLKRRKRMVVLESIDDERSMALAEPDVLEVTLERSDCIRKIRRVLCRVPVVYRRALGDHFISGLSIRQIARHQRIPQGTVLSRIFKGKQFLRAAWAA